MLTKTKTITGLSLAMLIAVISSGCMATPGQGEYVGKRTDNVSFSGYTLNPNETIYLYARKPGTTTWTYIGWARTGTHSYNHLGQDWYYWGRAVVIPQSCWNTGWFSASEVKATNASGTALYTFQKGFYSWFDDYNTLGDMWDDRGHGTTVTVLADK